MNIIRMPFINSDKRSQLKLVLIVKGTVTYVPWNIPPCLNGFHSLQGLFDYNIFIIHIFYELF